MHFWGPAGNAKYSYEQLRSLQGCEVGWGQGGDAKVSTLIKDGEAQREP